MLEFLSGVIQKICPPAGGVVVVVREASRKQNWITFISGLFMPPTLSGFRSMNYFCGLLTNVLTIVCNRRPARNAILKLSKRLVLCVWGPYRLCSKRLRNRRVCMKMVASMSSFTRASCKNENFQLVWDKRNIPESKDPRIYSDYTSIRCKSVWSMSKSMSILRFWLSEMK